MSPQQLDAVKVVVNDRGHHGEVLAAAVPGDFRVNAGRVGESGCDSRLDSLWGAVVHILLFIMYKIECQL
jgi:hypothetical protein